MNPTLFLAVGEFAAQVAVRLRGEALPLVLVEEFPSQPGELKNHFAHIAKALKSVLRGVAASSGSEETSPGRLDLILVADLAEVSGARLVGVLDGLSRLFLDEFAVLFPPKLLPEQRSVGLVALLSVPPLDGKKQCRDAVATLRAVERWHLDGPPSPLLNRLYVLPGQTEAMPLSLEDRERATVSFVLAAYGAGVRDSDAMRERLGPPRNPRALLSGFSVASVDVDVSRVQEAFAWRSAVAGLSRLLEEFTKVPARERVYSIADPLAAERFCEPIAALSKHPDAEADGPTRERWLLSLDRAEAEASRIFLSEVRRLLDEHLSGKEGFLGAGLLQQGLNGAAEKLLDDERALDASFSMPLLPPNTETPKLEEPEQADAANNDSLAFWQTASATVAASVGAGLLAFFVWALAVSNTAASAQGVGPRISGPAAVDASPLYGGLVCAAVVFGVYALWFGRRKQAVESSMSEAERAAQNKRRQKSESAAALVNVRQRRVMRAARLHLLALLERLCALQSTVADARVRATERLRGLGVSLGAGPDQDDYGGVLEQDAPLHRSLLHKDALPALWQKSQSLREADSFAHELLRAAWPMDWLTGDLPFAPNGAWEQALSAQHALLRQSGAFSWPDVGSALLEPLRAFFQAAPRALALGLKGQETDGTPSVLRQAHELLLLTPSDGRAWIERSLRDQPIAGAQVLSCAASASRVLLLRTSGELELSAIERGLP